MSGRRRLVSPLLALCIAQFILQLDFSIVNVALKTIQIELGFSAAGLQWVATSYALAFGSLLLLGGRLGDRLGRRRLLIAGLIVFGLSSLACGFAQTPAMLIASRFVQGAAAAMISPTVLSILTSIYPDGRERSRALGIWTASLAAGGSAGIVAGGVLTQYLGWRSIFLVNLPVIAVLIPVLRAVLPTSGGDRARRLDVPGAFQVSLGIAALIFGLTYGEQHSFDATLTIASLLASVLLLTGFVITEKRVAEPMFSFSFLAAPVRRTSTVAMFLIGGVVASYAYFIALYLQRVLGLSEVQTGLGLLPSGLLMATVSMFLAPRLIGRIGLKPSLLLALFLLAAGQFVFGHLAADSTYFADVLPGLVLNACGMGLTFTAVSIGITRNVAVEDQAVVGGLVPAAQQIGSAVVLAILATVAALVTSHRGGSLVAGYRVAFFAAAGIAVFVAVVVTFTSFRDVEVAEAGRQRPVLPAEEPV